MNTDTKKILDQVTAMLNLLVDDFEKLKAEPVSKKRWRANEVGAYYSTNAEGLVGKKIERNNDVDDHRHRSGDYSKTTGEACKRLAINYARQRIFDALREAEGDWVADWSDNHVSNQTACYLRHGKPIPLENVISVQGLEPQWYSSKEAWEAVIVSHKSDLLLGWGIEE